MDLRDYREMPNEGLFEKIERRVRLRRLVRVGGVAAAAAVVTVAAVWLLTPRSEVGIQKSEVMASANVLEVAEVEPTMTGNTQEHQTTPETTLVSKESQVAENIQPAVRRSEILNPQVPEPISISAQPIASAEQPSLPPAVVRTETAGMDEVFSEQSSVTNDHNVDVEGVKSGEPTPASPHYDNLLWAPNIICPMAEDAENRVFKVHSTSTVNDFHLVVYNRGGRQVFSTSDITRGWDATREGNLVPQGTYVWVARFRDSDGVLRQEKGTVTVVR